MLLDDPREVFSVTLLALGYSPNDQDPQHIKQAYLKIKALIPNIKLFNSNAMPAIVIDDDVAIGIAWNGDIHKAQGENPNVSFVFPKEGFVLWVDNFAIPKNAPHLENAYKFLNFMLRPDVAAQATLTFGYATANKKSLAYLPLKLRRDPIVFPTQQILSRGQFQTSLDEKSLMLYEKYWQLIKLGDSGPLS
jgi:spermidine/putrescine transport system substrate-binding protein